MSLSKTWLAGEVLLRVLNVSSVVGNFILRHPGEAYCKDLFTSDITAGKFTQGTGEAGIQSSQSSTRSIWMSCFWLAKKY